MRSTVLRILLLSASLVHAQDSTFSGDNAYAVLKTLVTHFGPRPMGSPAEQQALVFAVMEFGEYGCQESYVMPMTVADGVNTKSGIAVGILRGRTQRIIVIGGHMDSSGPEVPGANDDGSGAACVIELARVLGKRQHESTIVFCCWGGEEEGLRGSKYFVDHFSEIDSVALMVQIDMADGASVLEIDPDGGRVNAPSWLTKAAYETFYRDLNNSGLVYPTHGETINWSLGGGTGSDHASFLEKGIPAICFTTDVNYPIHTPQDNLENFNPSGLKRSGDLVLKLIERFDRGVPPRSTEKYMLVQFGSMPFFFPHWLLWSSIVVSVGFAVMSFLGVRRNREASAETPVVKWSGLKLLLCTLIIQAFIWYSENIVGLIRGYRFPWVNNFDGFILLGGLCGLLGLWLVLRILQRMRLDSDPYVYTRLAFFLLIILTLLFSIVGAKLAIYPAWALFFIALALRVKRPAWKLLFLLISPYLLIRLSVPEWLGLIQRLIALNTISSSWGHVRYNSTFVLSFTVLSLPFVYASVAVYRSSGIDLLWLKKFRRFPGLVVILLAACGLVAYLSSQSVYDRKWFNIVRVDQKYSLGSDSSAITLKGSEYLKDISMVFDGEESMLEQVTNFHQLRPAQQSAVSWCSVNGATVRSSDAEDSVRTLERRVEFHSKLRPLRVNIVFRSASPFEVTSTWATKSDKALEREGGHAKLFTWYSFPDTNLIVPLTFIVQDTQKIAQSIEVVYDRLAYPIRFKREFTNFIPRTTVTQQDTFSMATARNIE